MFTYQMALCEDNPALLTELHNICDEILCSMKIEYHINAYTKSADLLYSCKNNNMHYNTILLDLIFEQQELNGMQLARLIREFDKDVTIIFLTATGAFAEEGYEVRALRYLRKPVDKNLLKKLITEDYSEKYEKSRILIKDGAIQRFVAIQEIVYLEIKGRKVLIHLQDNSTCLFSGKLSEIVAQLPEKQFVQCHQSFAINVRQIREFDKQDAITVQGCKIPVSRANIKRVRDLFILNFPI